MKRIVQDLQIQNDTTPDGLPDGGVYTAFTTSPPLEQDPGYALRERVMIMFWQKGPLVAPDGTELPPNGLFLETAVRACIARLEYYQTTQFKSRENEIALTHLETALLWLGARAARREAEGTLGTHIPDTKGT